MSEGSRTVRIVTQDEALLASARGAVAALDGWEIAEPQSVEDLLVSEPAPGDVILLDAWLRNENVYESCSRLAGKTRCRTWVVTGERNDLAGPIAAFCGATGVIERPLSGGQLRAILDIDSTARELPEQTRGESEDRIPPERLLRDLAGDRATRLIDSLTDPETGLFSYDYLTFKLDEEFKRSKRFKLPLVVVMLGFEGQADEAALGAPGRP